jgi:hypothetical protein
MNKIVEIRPEVRTLAAAVKEITIAFGRPAGRP